MKKTHKTKACLFALSLIVGVSSLITTTSAYAATFGCKYQYGPFVSWGTGYSEKDATFQAKTNCAELIVGYEATACSQGSVTCAAIQDTNNSEAYSSRYDYKGIWQSIGYATNCYDANFIAQRKCIDLYPNYQKTVCMEGTFSCQQTNQ